MQRFKSLPIKFATTKPMIRCNNKVRCISSFVDQFFSSDSFRKFASKSLPLLAPNIQIRSHLNASHVNTCLCHNAAAVPEPLPDLRTFEKVSEETLQSLSDYFELITEDASVLSNPDVSYANGVLSVYLGEDYGTYVINRQTPNRQIWLSSPTSGPKRYDFIVAQNCWIYRHNGESLHQLLQDEMSRLIGGSVDFSQCVHAKLS